MNASERALRSSWQRRAGVLRTRFEDVADEYRRENGDGIPVKFAMTHYAKPFDELGNFNHQLAIRRYLNKRESPCCEVWSWYRIEKGDSADRFRWFACNLPGADWLLSQPEELQARLQKFHVIVKGLLGDGGTLLATMPFHWPESFPSCREAARDWLSILFEASWGPAHPFGLKTERLFVGGVWGETATPYIDRQTVDVEHEPTLDSLFRQLESFPEFGGEQPECFFAISRDVLRDSACLLEWLLSLCDTANAEQQAETRAGGGRGEAAGKQAETLAVGDGAGIVEKTPSKAGEASKPVELLGDGRKAQRRQIFAYYASRYAEMKLERQLSAQEAYDYWKEYGFDPADKDTENAAELAGYELPDSFPTFQSQLSHGRRAFDDSRYENRTGRKGRSIVSGDEIG